MGDRIFSPAGKLGIIGPIFSRGPGGPRRRELTESRREWWPVDVGLSGGTGLLAGEDMDGEESAPAIEASASTRTLFRGLLGWSSTPFTCHVENHPGVPTLLRPGDEAELSAYTDGVVGP